MRQAKTKQAQSPANGSASHSTHLAAPNPDSRTATWNNKRFFFPSSDRFHVTKPRPILLSGIAKSFAVEFATRNPNVRVNCIEPGPVMFPDEMSDKEKQALIEATLVKKADRPETVAKTVSFFIDNPMLTGCCIPLDGGRNVGREQHARTLQ
jgi:hypothetical protein